MFGWLGRLFRKTPKEVHPLETRLIYSYWDGTWVDGKKRIIKADPVELYKRITEVKMELGIAIKLSRSIHKDAPKGHTTLVEKIRTIFNIPPMKNGIECDNTLNDTEAAELLNDFMLFCNDIKKNWNPTSTTVKETSEATESTSDDIPPTENGSVSGSTEREESIEQPIPSPTA